jgi:hypothetical protein
MIVTVNRLIIFRFKQRELAAEVKNQVKANSKQMILSNRHKPKLNNRSCNT